MKRTKKLLISICMGVILFGSNNTAYAKTVQLDDGVIFDSDYYSDTYPDLKQAFGYDFDALLNHYIIYGKQEGRKTSEDSTPENVVIQTNLVSIDKLANKKSLQKKCSKEEFQAAYDAAVQIVTPLVGLSEEQQLAGIASALRAMVDSGQVTYSDNIPHYNDPYGYLIAGAASCAGCTRTTGLCLNMLGISYEHVNENQWTHQWCRVNINGTYWICDAYGLYVGPEPAPYAHPRL